MTVAVQRNYIIVEDCIKGALFYLHFGPVYTNTKLSLIVDFVFYQSSFTLDNQANKSMQDHCVKSYLFDGPHKCKNSTIFLRGEKIHENKNWHHDEKQR